MATVQSIPTQKLTKRQAEPKVGSVISPWRKSVADTLTPQRLGRIMRAADEGDIEAYLTLAEEMEEREPHYSSVLYTRKMAVSGTQPMVESPDDSAASKKITEAVEQRIVKTPEFEGLVHDLMDGVNKGFACVEIVWERSESEWYPLRYEFREQRYFTFDADTMSIPMLRTDDKPDEGEPLKPYGWLVHKPKIRSGIPIRTGLARPVAVCYAAKRWTVADWLAFMDIYGIPIRLGKYPATMAEQSNKLLRAIQKIGTDACAVVPKEMDLEIITVSGTSGGGGTLFQQGAEYWDAQTSKVVLGQTMTTDDGSSLAQAKVHENTRFDIRDADSRAVAATINRDLIKPFVDLNFGAQKVYPQVRIKQRKSEELVPLFQATKILVDLGGKVQMSEARDRLGYAEPEEDAELLQPSVKPAAPGAPKNTEGDSNLGDPAGDKKQIDSDGKSSDLNTSQAERARTFDTTDDVTEEELKQWRSLEEGNVGKLMRLIQDADSYEEARALLAELAKDEGDVLDVGALVVSLARSTFKLRGNGDATDKVKP